MSSGRAKEFDQYARECVRLAEGAEDPDLREKLLRQAREWMQAEMDVKKTINETAPSNML